MKLPQSRTAGAFQIGEKKYVLLVALTLIEADESDQPTSLAFRPGEVIGITTSPEGSAESFSMETAYIFPAQLEAESLEQAAAQLGIELTGLANRIIEHESDALKSLKALPADFLATGW